jgi:RNA polymerase sigma factor (sigma-70 family)
MTEKEAGYPSTMNQPFESVVTAHGPTILRVCRAVLGPHADSDDAWSETFLAALEAWPTLAPDANVEAWLVTIAHRKAVDIVRRRTRQAVPVGELPERVSTIGVPDATDHDLWGALARLPDKQRQAVAYHYVGGLPYAEVAQLLGGSADAARRAASDGIQALRTTYASTELKGSIR